MEDAKTLFCSSKFPWARKRITSKIYKQFGHAPSKRFACPSLDGAELTRRPIDARSCKWANYSALVRTRRLLRSCYDIINNDYVSVSANSIGPCNDD